MNQEINYLTIDHFKKAKVRLNCNALDTGGGGYFDGDGSYMFNYRLGNSPPNNISISRQSYDNFHGKEKALPSEFISNIPSDIIDKVYKTNSIQKINICTEKETTGDQMSPGKKTGDLMSPGKKTGDQMPPDKKAGDQISPNKKTGDQMPPDKKTGDQMPPDKKTGDQMSPDKKTGDQMPPDKKTGDQISPDKKTGDQMPPDKKICDQMPPDKKTDDQMSPDKKPGDQMPPDKKPGDQMSPDKKTDVIMTDDIETDDTVTDEELSYLQMLKKSYHGFYRHFQGFSVSKITVVLNMIKIIGAENKFTFITYAELGINTRDAKKICAELKAEGFIYMKLARNPKKNNRGMYKFKWNIKRIMKMK